MEIVPVGSLQLGQRDGARMVVFLWAVLKHAIQKALTIKTGARQMRRCVGVADSAASMCLFNDFCIGPDGVSSYWSDCLYSAPDEFCVSSADLGPLCTV
jgi:hypothetical protein